MTNLKSQLVKGQRALELESYEEAFNTLLPCADAGVMDAEAIIGLLYMLGLGTSRDLLQAIKFLTSAAEKGSGVAAHNLGTLHLTGEPDLSNDEAESKKWFKRASDLGFKPGSH